MGNNGRGMGTVGTDARYHREGLEVMGADVLL